MKRSLLLYCLFALLYSCKKDPVAGPAGPAGTNGINGNPDRGTISGNVKQYNRFGKVYFTGLNTTTVSISGTTISVVTDSAGNYKLTNVAAGVYDLLFNRKGSRIHKSTEVNFPGNGNLSVHVQLCDTAHFKILTAEIKDSIYQGEPHVFVNLTTLAENYDRCIALIFGDRPEIIPDDPFTFKMSLTANLPALNSVASFFFPFENSFISERFQAGQLIYVKAYPAVSPPYLGQYYDVKTNQYLFSMLGRPFPSTFTLTMQ